MSLPRVYFDESGHTGQDLMQRGQPVFVLASVALTSEIAETLLEPVRAGAKEFHLTRLRGRRRRQVVEVINSTLLSKDTVKIFAVHKPYMVTTKIVDLLIEPLARHDRIDLYARGGHVAFANLLHWVTPAFCSREAFERFQHSFVSMIRSRTASAVRKFYQSTEELRRRCHDEQFKQTLGIIGRTHLVVGDVLKQLKRHDLDPAFTVLISLCFDWDVQIGSRFELIHDRSKPIREMLKIFERLADPGMPSIVIGPDRRKVSLPLKATGISLVDSVTSPQVQVADLLAGAFAHALNPFRKNDEISEACLQRSDFMRGGLWPSRDLTLEELEVEHAGENIVDGIGRYFEQQRIVVED